MDSSDRRISALVKEVAAVATVSKMALLASNDEFSWQGHYDNRCCSRRGFHGAAGRQ
jgi:hypothetical protein